MNTLRWRALIVAVLMLTGGVLATFGRPTRHLADEIGQPRLDTLFPKAFGAWHIVANPAITLPLPDVQAALNAIYNQVLSRAYKNASGDVIMLTVAYGGDQSDGAAAHRPEACYPAQGFEILANRSATLQVGPRQIPVRQLMAKRGQRLEPITYWVAVGDRVVTTGVGQKLAQLQFGLGGVIADGMLVRVSSIDADMDHANALHASFIDDLSRATDTDMIDRVFGEVPGGP